MRATIMVGLILIALGGSALYQIRNGFFMFVVGHATHWPPADEAALAAEFDKLGEEITSVSEVPLRTMAALQSKCVAAITGQTLTAGAEAGFQRLSLILLGAGKNSLSPVIPPLARRIPELRRDLTMPDRDYREPELQEKDETRMRDIFSDLTEPEHPIYLGTGLADNFGHIDLKNQVEAMLNGGSGFHRCVSGT
jgi:hypothetical protein